MPERSEHICLHSPGMKRTLRLLLKTNFERWQLEYDTSCRHEHSIWQHCCTSKGSRYSGHCFLLFSPDSELFCAVPSDLSFEELSTFRQVAAEWAGGWEALTVWNQTVLEACKTCLQPGQCEDGEVLISLF